MTPKVFHAPSGRIGVGKDVKRYAPLVGARLRAAAAAPLPRCSSRIEFTACSDRFGVIFITGNSFAVSPFFSLQNSEGVCDKIEIFVVGAAQAGDYEVSTSMRDNG
jgi:hypothetical protein